MPRCAKFNIRQHLFCRSFGTLPNANQNFSIFLFIFFFFVHITDLLYCILDSMIFDWQQNFSITHFLNEFRSTNEMEWRANRCACCFFCRAYIIRHCIRYECIWFLFMFFTISLFLLNMKIQYRQKEKNRKEWKSFTFYMVVMENIYCNLYNDFIKAYFSVKHQPWSAFKSNWDLWVEYFSHFILFIFFRCFHLHMWIRLVRCYLAS